MLDCSNILKTVALDLRGRKSTARAPFIALRPAVADTREVIRARTARIQAAIDAKAASGGGIVYLGEGVFTVGTLIIRSRTGLVGCGKDKTALLASPYLKYGERVLESENFSDMAARFIDDPRSSAKWLVDGSPMRIVLAGFSLDGNGANSLNGTYADVWDMELRRPNADLDNVGIAMYCTGLRMDDIQVYWCSGDGVQLFRGNNTLKGSRTPLDTAETIIGEITCMANGGDGLWAAAFPDGVINNYTGLSNGGNGMTLGGANWNCLQVHTYGNRRHGVVSENGGMFSIMQCESEHGCGWINRGLTGTAGILNLYQNNRTHGAATCVAERTITVNAGNIGLGPMGKNSTGLAAFKFEERGNNSRVNCNINVNRHGTHSNLTLFDDYTKQDGLTINMDGGWMQGQKGVTVLRKHRASPANRIDIKVKNNNHPITLVDGRIRGSDRIRMAYSGLAVLQINNGGSVPSSKSFEAIKY